MYRKSSLIISKIVIIAILSALGFILMSFTQIPYPIAPWLKIELSEVATLFGFSLFSLPGGIFVGLYKTLLDISAHGITPCYGIGNITAFITSTLYCLFFYIVSKYLKLFHHKFIQRLIGYIIIVINVSLILTILNALYITPSYLKLSYTTCFDKEIKEGVVSWLNNLSGTKIDSYFLLIFVVYFPFNLIKGISVFLIYELLYKRLFTIIVEKSSFMKKYFVLDNRQDEELKATYEDEFRYVYYN